MASGQVKPPGSLLPVGLAKDAYVQLEVGLKKEYKGAGHARQGKQNTRR